MLDGTCYKGGFMSYYIFFFILKQYSQILLAKEKVTPVIYWGNVTGW